MRIRSVRVLNFKCFRDSAEIELAPGFNVITGKNNTGKTALAQAISLTIDDKPHRSLANAPTPTFPPTGFSSVHLKLALGVDEFFELLRPIGPDFYIPKTPNSPDDDQLRDILDAYAHDELTVFLDYRANGFAGAYLETPGAHVQSEYAFQFSIPQQGQTLQLKLSTSGVRMDQTAPYLLAPTLRQQIYLFKAERFNVGQHGIGPDPTLLPDASNLAQTLNNLQTRNPAKFEALVSHVHAIFPDIHYVTSPPHESGGGLARITLWPLDTSSQRQDLAVPLQESGTGVGQILAILYVAISSERSRPIVIDEPQSFLHPGAIRTLLTILQSQYSQHQYVVTTHSPIVIGSLLSPQVIRLVRAGPEATIETIQPSDQEALQAILAEVGARPSDVFGVDNVLWVEGATEESCFPLIIAGLLNRPLFGTAIIGIVNTGDFEGKHAQTILNIYRRLSASTGLLPPAIGFIFDRESRTPEEQDDVIRLSAGTVRFTHRRMYENYLLHPDAIASVISLLPNFSDPYPSSKDISDWLTQRGGNPKYLPHGTAADPPFDQWLLEAHGARILADLFLSLSEGRYEYDKVAYGLSITRYLLKHDPSQLADIANIVKELLEKHPVGGLSGAQ